MLHRVQNCEFSHIESRGKNNVTNLRKLQSTSFFSTHGAFIIQYSYQPVSFQTLLRILQNGDLVTIEIFWPTPYAIVFLVWLNCVWEQSLTCLLWYSMFVLFEPHFYKSCKNNFLTKDLLTKHVIFAWKSGLFCSKIIKSISCIILL